MLLQSDMQWENGLLPTLCSDFSARPGSGNGITFPRNWAVFDGDLPGPHWALLEPLVAAKGSLCLPSGERFRVPAGAALIFETPGVSKLTPAALSDTKIVHLNREETVSAKVVSKWVLNLPTEIFFLKGHLAGLVGAAKPLWTMGGGSEPGSRSGASVNTTHFIALFEHLMRKDPHVVAARKLSQSAEEGAAKSAAESAGNKTNGEVLTGHILSRSFSLDKQPGGTPKQAKCPPGSAGELAEAIHTAEQMATLYFVFCILWAIGGSASDRSRGELECRVRERFDGLAPKGAFPLSDNGSLFDLRVCGVKRAFVPWLGSANPGDFHPVTLPGLTYPRHSSPLLHVPTVESERARAVLELAIVGGLPPLLIGPPSSRKSFIMQLAASNLITKEEFASATAFMTRGTSAASLSDVLKAHLVPGGKRKALRTPLGQRLLVVIDDVHLSFEGPKSASEAPGSLELLRQVLGSGTMYRSAERSSVEITGLQLALTGEPGEPTLPIRLNGRVFTLAINDPPPQSVCQAILATCVNTLSTGEVPLPSAHEMTSAAADALVAVQKLCRVRLTSVRNPAERARVTSASRVLGLGAFARALRALRRLHESHTQLDGIPAGGMTGERNEHRADGAGRKRESSSDLDVPNFVGLLKKAQKGRGSDGGTERAEPEGAESGGFEGLGIPWPEVLRGAVMESVGTRADEGFRALLDGALADAVEKAGEKVARARATMMPLAQKPANLLRGGEWPVPERKGGSGTLAERQIWRAKLWAIWEEKKEDGEHVAVANANPVAAKATKHVQFKEDKTKVQRGKAASPQPTAPLRQPDVTETSANPLESFPEAEIHFAKLVDLLVGGEALAVIGPPCCGKRRIVTAALKFLGSEAVEITAASPETSSMDIIRDLREGMLRAAAEKPAKGSASASLLIGNVIAENVDVLTWLADAVVSGRIPRDESERKTASAGKGRAKNQQSSGNKISSRDQPPTDAQSKPATCPRVVLLCTDATWRALTDGFPELQKRLRVWRFNPPADLAVMEFADRGLGRVWDTQPEQALRQRADWNFSDEKGGYLLRQNKINDLWKDRPAPPPDAPNPPEALEGFGSWAPSSAAAAAAAVYERARALLAAQGLEVSLAGRQLGAFVRLAGGLWRGAKGVLRRRRRGLEACLDRLQAIQKGLVKSNDDADGLQPALEALLEQRYGASLALGCLVSPHPEIQFQHLE